MNRDLLAEMRHVVATIERTPYVDAPEEVLVSSATVRDAVFAIKALQALRDVLNEWIALVDDGAPLSKA